MIQVKNKYLVLIALFALGTTFTIGWRMGRLSGDRASEGLISYQIDIIKGYVFDLDSANRNIEQKEILIAAQKQIIEESFVRKETLDKIILAQNTKLSRLEQKIDTLLEKDSRIIIIIPPIDWGYNGTLLSEKFCEQNNITQNINIHPKL